MVRSKISGKRSILTVLIEMTQIKMYHKLRYDVQFNAVNDNGRQMLVGVQPTAYVRTYNMLASTVHLLVISIRL